MLLDDVGDATDGEFDDVESDSGSEIEGEVGVWSASGVTSEAYKRTMVVWKNEIRGKGQKFTLADAFRYRMWKYAIAHQFDYKLERN